MKQVSHPIYVKSYSFILACLYFLITLVIGFQLSRILYYKCVLCCHFVFETLQISTFWKSNESNFDIKWFTADNRGLALLFSTRACRIGSRCFCGLASSFSFSSSIFALGLSILSPVLYCWPNIWIFCWFNNFCIRHNVKGFQFGFLGLCFVWGLLRAFFWLLTPLDPLSELGLQGYERHVSQFHGHSASSSYLSSL